VVSKKSAELKKADRTESKAGGKAGSKSAKSIKEENQTLSLGVFTIYPVTAEVKPSESATVHIDCHVENENKFCEELMVHISESNPADTGSKTLTLRAQCCIPVVDFENIENIFQEQYICQYLNEFESPVQV
ncbi:Hydrocephalus-inducing protein, partial [Blattella germanica]